MNQQVKDEILAAVQAIIDQRLAAAQPPPQGNAPSVQPPPPQQEQSQPQPRLYVPTPPPSAAYTTSIDGFRTPTISRSSSLSGSSLERSSSLSSTWSSASSRMPSLESDDQDDSSDENEGGVPPIKRRRKTDPQLARDVKVVTKPILEVLDKMYLAPRRSPLFRRLFKRTKNADGTRSLKQNPDIVLKLFKRLVKPVLRTLLGNARMGDQDLVSRYFKAALKVVKKRRANHIQAWRLTNRHKPLIYNGRNLFSSQRHRTPRRSPPLSQSQRESSPPGSGFDTDSEDDSPAEISAAAAAYAAASAASTAQGSNHPPCTITPVSTTCIDCKKKFDFNSGMGEWSTSSSKRPVRCESCFDKYVKKTYTEFVHENRPSGEDERRNVLADRDSQGNKKRKRRTSCKWCGSTTHVTRRSLACPKNPRYRGEESDGSSGSDFFFSVSSKAGGYFTPPLPGYFTPPPLPHTGNAVATDAAPAPSDQPVAEDSASSVAPVAEESESSVAPVAEESASSVAPVAEESASSVAPVAEESDTDAPAETFNVGDNVYAKWKRGQYFLAHVTHCDDGRYTVYFLDGNVKGDIGGDELRPVDPNDQLGAIKRADMLNKDFFFDGEDDLPAGRWRVRRIVDNEYKCVRLTGGCSFHEGQMEGFDIGYVLRCHQQELEQRRVAGFGDVLNYSRR